jgi:hypothetical protein
MVAISKIFAKNSFLFGASKYIDPASCCVYIVMIIGCLAYFFELFKLDNLSLLNQKPSFWIVTGCLFYSTYSLPFLLIAQKVLITNKQLFILLYSGHYITFSFVFIMLIKAFICRKPLTI